MKMMYGNVPVNSLKVKHYELNTNGATTVPSAVQAGLTYYANGRKEVGTGKCFSFATYGGWVTNRPDFVPTVINVINIGCTDYPLVMTVPMSELIYYDFSVAQKVAEVVIDDETYPITVSVQNNMFLVSCEKTITIELFFGKDEYL